MLSFRFITADSRLNGSCTAALTTFSDPIHLL